MADNSFSVRPGFWVESDLIPRLKKGGKGQKVTWLTVHNDLAGISQGHTVDPNGEWVDAGFSRLLYWYLALSKGWTTDDSEQFPVSEKEWADHVAQADSISREVMDWVVAQRAES